MFECVPLQMCLNVFLCPSIFALKKRIKHVLNTPFNLHKNENRCRLLTTEKIARKNCRQNSSMIVSQFQRQNSCSIYAEERKEKAALR